MIPVSLVTGFLGSGKTTLIGHLLRDPALSRTLVIVNEFGEVGIDHDLLEASSDDTILLANGCLCCTIRGNLVDTLLDLQAQREDGRLRDFDRVLVETSGVVDPAPVLGFMFSDPRVAAIFRPGAVITTCDAVAGLDVLGRHPEAVSQVVTADRLLVTKSDLASAVAVEALAAKLRQINAAAPITVAVQGEGVEPKVLDVPGGRHDHTACQPDCSDPTHKHHMRADRSADHANRFRAQLLHATRPLSFEEVTDLTRAVGRAATPALVRLKGILPLSDMVGCVAIQAAPSAMHEPTLLEGRPSQQGSVILITEGPAPARLLSAMRRFGILPAGRPESHSLPASAPPGTPARGRVR
jgi:G3E family GTPase